MIALQNPHLKVTVVDRDPIRIKQWNSKHLPIHEPGLQNIIRITRDGTKSFCISNSQPPNNLAKNPSKSRSKQAQKETTISARSPNLIFSIEVARNISEADIIFISVNTPTKRSGIGAGKATDMTAVEAVTREIAIHARDGAIIVEKSTVPCRTAEMIRSIVRFFPLFIPPSQTNNDKAEITPSQSKLRNPLQPRIPLRRNLNPQPPSPLPNPHRQHPHTLRSPRSLSPLLPLRILDPTRQNNDNKHLLLRTLKTRLQRLPRAKNQLHKRHLLTLRENRCLYF